MAAHSRLGLRLAPLLLAGISGCALLTRQFPPADFHPVLPQEIRWRPHPIVTGAEFAVLVGDPAKAEPTVVRMRFPANVRIMPHTHPEARTYTVLAGEWQLGFGARFEARELRRFPAGSVYRLPAGAPHWQATGPEGATIQIESVGPTRTDFLNPSDDPRRP